ncbi:MAG TPA: MgtC/SapB family protein [Allosphingosinicella sp.]|nr:MgtC/SapB family protein [Allosphingosinicella sp.]
MIDLTEIALRLSLATLAGLLLGFDRELKGLPAGLRTHGLVALSSAAITVSAFQMYQQLGPQGTHIDPLRVTQGLAQAIGFIAAGIIFASRGVVRNVTTAANLWLASAIGIAAGAAQFELVGVAFVLGILLLIVVGAIERRLIPQPDTAGADAERDGLGRAGETPSRSVSANPLDGASKG